VVANEVKTLATQTAKATDEITSQIAGVQSATAAAVEAIHSITATIGTINETTTAIAAAIEQQSAATEEIVRNVKAASADTHEVSDSVVEITLASGASYGAAIQVMWAAGDIDDPVHQLRHNLSAFLEAVRSR